MNIFATSVCGFRKYVFFLFLPHNYTFFFFLKNTAELKLKIIKFSVEWVYFHRSWMKLTHVMPLNIIQFCETHVFHCISMIYHIIIHFFEKYVRIKIKAHIILVQLSKLSLKLNEVNANYACKLNSILWDFYVFHQFTTRDAKSKEIYRCIAQLIYHWGYIDLSDILREIYQYTRYIKRNIYQQIIFS